MHNQHVSIGVIDHPDKETVATKVLIDLLQVASAGAWYAYYNLSSEGKRIVQKIQVSICVSPDGTTPDTLKGMITVSSTAEMGEWQDQGDFTILSISTKNPLMFRNEVTEMVRTTFKEIIQKERERRNKQRLALARLEIHSPGNPFPS